MLCLWSSPFSIAVKFDTVATELTVLVLAAKIFGRKNEMAKYASGYWPMPCDECNTAYKLRLCWNANFNDD